MTNACHYVSDLDLRAQQLLQAGLRQSTHVTYSSLQSQFISFCRLHALVPLPASESTILRFLAYLSYRPGRQGLGLAPSTYSSFLASIRSLHLFSGYTLPVTSSPKISLLLKSFRNSAPPPAQKSPITFHLLCNIISLLPKDYNGLLIQSALTLGFYGTLRGCEYSETLSQNGIILYPSPKLSAVTFGTHMGLHYMVFKVPASKTLVHPFHKFIGCSRSHPACAPCAMHLYLQARACLGIDSPDAPLYLWKDLSVLNKGQLNTFIKDLVFQLGLEPSKFSTHSLRAGSISQGSRTLPSWLLKSMGNWKSSCWQLYVRDTAVQHINIAAALASTNN